VTDEAEFKLVKSAQRTLEILEILGAAREPITVAELYRQTGYPRSSLHQLLHTLLAMRWVESSTDGTAVGIGPRALLTGTAYLDRDPALPFATRALEQIRDKVNYTSHYARLDGPNVIYLATRETADSHRAVSRVGRQLPAHATALGKALLAELTPREVTALLPGPLTGLTRNTLTDTDALLLNLEQTRVRGHAVEHEENSPGIGCVALVVPYRIPATDAISCSIPVAAATGAELDRVAEVIRDHAQQLAARLRSEGIR
jgi:IclR family transcriptional regulator, acetate operon repressor